MFERKTKNCVTCIRKEIIGERDIPYLTTLASFLCQYFQRVLSVSVFMESTEILFTLFQPSFDLINLHFSLNDFYRSMLSSKTGLTISSIKCQNLDRRHAAFKEA